MEDMKRDAFDIVIIGAGLGGLAAGTLLSRKGFKTLLIESKNRVGGRFSTVEYEGFKLPTGAILIPEGWVVKLMDEMGLGRDLLRPVSRFFYRIDGTVHEIPPEGGLPLLLDLIDKLERERARESGRAVRPVAMQRILEGYLMGTAGIKDEKVITVRDWLLQYTENEKAHEVFDTLCAALLMAHSWELPVSSLFAFQEMQEFYISSKGNLAIAEELAMVVKKNGAVWTGCHALRITMDQGRATGVVVEKDGKELEIPCQMVVSDAGPRKTVEMAGMENFDEAYLRNMRIKLRPSPSLLVLVASDRPLCLDGVTNGFETILGGRRLRTVVPVSNVCPELAPPGQHLLYASVEPGSSLHPMDRKYEIQQCRRDLKELFPDFERHGRILKVKPCDITNDWPEGRTWVGYGLPLETTIPNLFNVGDACLAPGLTGTTGAVETGYRAAATIENTLD